MTAMQIRPAEVLLPPWPMSPMAEQVYRRLAPWTTPDRDRGWALAALVEGLTAVASWIDEAAEQGIEVFLDPSRCPWWALRWCGQIHGVTVLPTFGAFMRPDDVTIARWRREIADLPRRRRGHPDSMIAAARQYMVGAQRVSFRERYDGSLGAGVDAPYHMQMRVRASDVDPRYLVTAPGPVYSAPLLEAAVRRTKPLGRILDFEVSNYATFDDRRDAHATFDAMRDAYDDFNDLRDAD